MKELDAGRELDALIAEKIFGCKIDRDCGYCVDNMDHDGEHGDWRPYCACRAHLPLGSGIEHPGVDGGADVPFYSTDIAAAWEVVYKLREKRLWFDIDNHPMAHATAEWEACFGFLADQSDFSAESDSAPHAICLAALKTLEGS